MVSGHSLITPLNIVSNQCLDIALFVGHAVQAFDDIRVIVRVEPKVILFPGALVVFCCVSCPILPHYLSPRYAITIVKPIKAAAIIQSFTAVFLSRIR